MDANGVGGTSRLKAENALKTLSSILGHGYVLYLEDVQTSEFVVVPKSKDRWIVVGQWEDGTVDIFKEDGSFPEDLLVGWRRGQSVTEYFRELKEENDAEDDPSIEQGGSEPQEGAGTVVPLHSGS